MEAKVLLVFGGCMHACLLPCEWWWSSVLTGASTGGSLHCHVLLHLGCLKQCGFLGRFIPYPGRLCEQGSACICFPQCQSVTSICTKMLPASFASVPCMQPSSPYGLSNTYHLLLNWTTSYELVLQLYCPPYTFWMSPQSSL